MNRWLLDTNVISEPARPKPDWRVRTFIDSQPADNIFISDITLAEIRFGIESNQDDERRKAIALWLEKEVRPVFAGRALPVTEDIIVVWRTLVARGRRIRHTFTQPDLFLAATALHHGLTIVTRDTSDFLLAGTRVFNPWTDPLPA